MTILMRTWNMLNNLLNEQDLSTSTPQRWRKEQLTASTKLVWLVASVRVRRQHGGV